MPTFFDERRPHHGFTYTEYREYWKQEKKSLPEDPDASDRRMHHYLNYNWDRQAHVHDRYEPSDELQTALMSVVEPELWMVITEPWCGDSAFLLPVIAEAADCSDDITLRILLRDENLDIIDQYLTGGSRSIPKLVAFSEQGQELFTWGPRPDGAVQRYQDLSQQHEDKMDAVAGLLEYYSDGGWREADGELAECVHGVATAQEPMS